MEQQDARGYFPRGLRQPEGRFRFSADALLLASFADRARGVVADLGTGCGVAGLALLLRRPRVERVMAVDADPAMVEAAGENAALLGLGDRLRAVELDLRQIRQAPEFHPESVDAALCNPPYRAPGQGRLPPSAERTRARFETGGGLTDFLDAAAYLLKNRGALYVVYLAERLATLFAGLAAARLEPKRMTAVHSRLDEPARLALVEAVKNGRPGLKATPPLVLYQGQGEATRLTPGALEFCDFLACNPRGAAPADNEE